MGWPKLHIKHNLLCGLSNRQWFLQMKILLLLLLLFLLLSMLKRRIQRVGFFICFLIIRLLITKFIVSALVHRPNITARQICVAPRFTTVSQLCYDCKETLDCEEDVNDRPIVKFIMCGKCAFANKNVDLDNKCYILLWYFLTDNVI